MSAIGTVKHIPKETRYAFLQVSIAFVAALGC